MMSQNKVILGAVGLMTTVASACLIPDRDIVVIFTDPCGEEWSAQTVGAKGYNGVGLTDPIQTEDEKWITKSYCLNAGRAEQMADPTSDLAAEALSDIAHICQERAYEMGLADSDDTCITTADIAYIGTCMHPPAGCDGGTGDGGTGDGGTGDGGTGDDPGVINFGSSNLRAR